MPGWGRWSTGNCVRNLTIRQNDYSTKWPFHKMTILQNDYSTKWPFYKMTIPQNDHSIKWSFYKMTIPQNDHSTKWPFYKMTIPQNDHSTKWPFHKMEHTQQRIDLENETYKILQDLETQIDSLIPARRSNLVFFKEKKKKKTCQLVDFAVSSRQTAKWKSK